jgi:transposase
VLIQRDDRDPVYGTVTTPVGARWALVELLIPPAKRGATSGRSTGCQWRAIPKDLPPRSTVYDYFDLWRWDGTLRLGRLQATIWEVL